MAEQTPPVPDDHTNAVARAMRPSAFVTDASQHPMSAGVLVRLRDMAAAKSEARDLLASTDPAVLDAFEAALVRAGRLPARRVPCRDCDTGYNTTCDACGCCVHGWRDDCGCTAEACGCFINNEDT